MVVRLFWLLHGRHFQVNSNIQSSLSARIAVLHCAPVLLLNHIWETCEVLCNTSLFLTHRNTCLIFAVQTVQSGYTCTEPGDMELQGSSWALQYAGRKSSNLANRFEFILWNKRAEFSLSTVLVYTSLPQDLLFILGVSKLSVNADETLQVRELKIYIAQNSWFLWLLLYNEKQSLVTSPCNCIYIVKYVGRIIIFCCIYIVTVGEETLRATGCVCLICCKNKTQTGVCASMKFSVIESKDNNFFFFPPL